MTKTMLYCEKAENAKDYRICDVDDDNKIITEKCIEGKNLIRLI